MFTNANLLSLSLSARQALHVGDGFERVTPYLGLTLTPGFTLALTLSLRSPSTTRGRWPRTGDTLPWVNPNTGVHPSPNPLSLSPLAQRYAWAVVSNRTTRFRPAVIRVGKLCHSEQGKRVIPGGGNGRCVLIEGGHK